MKKDYREEASALKAEIINEIKDILIAHGRKKAEFAMNCCDSPSVINVPNNDEETYVVDSVGLTLNKRTGIEWVEVEYSNSYTNSWNIANNLDIEVLIDILETMERYGDELFEEFEDED